MNLLFSCIGKRGYIADFFRPHLSKNDRIIGTSNTKWTPGFDHCDKNYLLPDTNNPNYISKVLDICQQESITAILSFFDPDVVELAKNFERFEKIGVIPVLPKYEIADICFDKYKTFEFLRKNQINTPNTYVEYSSAIEALDLGIINFPLFVKPRRGYGSALTFKAHNLLELNAFFNYAPDMIVQEEVVGEAIDFDILNDLQGKAISVVPWKKYRSRMGETEQAQTFYDEKIIDFGLYLGSLLGHRGPLDADLFLHNGEIIVLEINLRFGGGYPVSHLAGANFPMKILSMIRGETVDTEYSGFLPGVMMMKDNLVVGGPEPDYFKAKYLDWA
jgi:carbamoyl-phosphate synthase large subunit